MELTFIWSMYVTHCTVSQMCLHFIQQKSSKVRWALWCRGLYHCFRQLHPLLGDWFKSQLLNLPSSFHIRQPGGQQMMPQPLSPLPFPWEIRMEFWDATLPCPSPSYCGPLGSESADTIFSFFPLLFSFKYTFLRVTSSEFCYISHFMDVNANVSRVTC